MTTSTPNRTQETTNVSVAIARTMKLMKTLNPEMTELETEMIEDELRHIAYAQTVDCKNKMNEILNQIYK